MSEPKRPVVHDHTEIKVRQHAVYADVILKDADGKFWKFSGAAFYYDMEPVSPLS